MFYSPGTLDEAAEDCQLRRQLLQAGFINIRPSVLILTFDLSDPVMYGVISYFAKFPWCLTLESAMYFNDLQ